MVYPQSICIHSICEEKNIETKLKKYSVVDSLKDKEFSLYKSQIRPYHSKSNLFVKECKQGHKFISLTCGSEYIEVNTPIQFAVKVPNHRFNVLEYVWANDSSDALNKILIQLLQRNIACYSPTDENPYEIYYVEDFKWDGSKLLTKPVKTYTTLNQIGDIIVFLKKEFGLREGMIIPNKDTGQTVFDVAGRMKV
jgi:hypothetical protein